jgi:hypothetical protein
LHKIITKITFESYKNLMKQKIYQYYLINNSGNKIQLKYRIKKEALSDKEKFEPEFKMITQ